MPQTKTTKPKDKPAKKDVKNSLVAPNSNLTLTFKWSEVEPVKHKVAAKLAQKVKIDGFRKGKVPTHIAKAYLKPEAVIESTLEQLLPQAFLDQVKKLDKPPIAPPEYQVKSVADGGDWQVEAIYAIRPEFKLGKYLDLAKKAVKEAELEYKKQLKELEKKNKADKKADPKQPQPPAEPTRDFLLNAVYRKLVTTIKPKVQELLVKRETQSELQSLDSRLKSLNLKFEDYLKRSNITFDQLSTELAGQSLGRLQLVFIMQDIAKEAKITVSDKEVEKELKGQKPDERMTGMAREHLIRQKIADHLLDFLPNKK
jgi:FKBP-type peptidyl-prolyl cis-trans isomerase (trigger factor)